MKKFDLGLFLMDVFTKLYCLVLYLGVPVVSAIFVYSVLDWIFG